MATDRTAHEQRVLEAARAWWEATCWRVPCEHCERAASAKLWRAVAAWQQTGRSDGVDIDSLREQLAILRKIKAPEQLIKIAEQIERDAGWRDTQEE